MLQQLMDELALTKTNLVAVTKTQPNEAILQLYRQGHCDFGENRVQELVRKYEALPKDIRWHLIGHLQTNKVKYIASFVHLIHSVDSIGLLLEIEKEAAKVDRVIRVLLQFKIAREESKYGFDLQAGLDLLTSPAFKTLKNVQVIGVMGMATLTEDERQIESEFKTLKNIFDRLKNDFFRDESSFREISMGMSGDYKIALRQGSTMVRIGSLLFEK